MLGASLLIVDDSEINLALTRRVLEHAGARVTLANNGQNALALLRDSPDAFDAVLMDVQMPEMDGLQATRHIRQTLGLEGLPIFALTAGALVSECQRAIDAGMDELITKPFEPQALIQLLSQRLGSEQE